MGYWLVMAIVALAMVAVVIALTADNASPSEPEKVSKARPVWVAIGTNGRSPDQQIESIPASWVDLVRDELGDAAICYDFTLAGCTAEEAQREQLEAAVAAAPDVVSILVGPDDFRDAEDLGSFERRLWHILSTLRSTGATFAMADLPDLTSLPTLAAEEDQASLREELATWNVAVARLVAAAGGELIAHPRTVSGAGDVLFTETAGRYILTGAGQRWFASLMEPPVRRLIGLAEETGAPPSAAPDTDK